MTDRIFNQDIRCGLFHITINEAWIHTSASERYGEEFDFDFDETDEMKIEIVDLLNKLCNEVEIAINRQRFDWIEVLINDCITDYANIFPEIGNEDVSEDEDESESEEDESESESEEEDV